MKVDRKGAGGLTVIALALLLFEGTTFFMGINAASDVLEEEIEFATGDSHVIAETHTKRELLYEEVEKMIEVSVGSAAVEIGKEGGKVGNGLEYDIQEFSELNENKTWIETVPDVEPMMENYQSRAEEIMGSRSLVWDCEDPSIDFIDFEDENISVEWSNPEIECEDRTGGRLIAVSTVEVEPVESEFQTNFSTIAEYSREFSSKLKDELESEFEENETREETEEYLQDIIEDVENDFKDSEFPAHDPSEEEQGIEISMQPKTIYREEEEDEEELKLVGANISLIDHRNEFLTEKPSVEPIEFDWVLLVEP